MFRNVCIERDTAAADLARLQRIASTAELISAEAELKNDNESKSLSISNNLLRDLADALKQSS